MKVNLFVIFHTRESVTIFAQFQFDFQCYRSCLLSYNCIHAVFDVLVCAPYGGNEVLQSQRTHWNWNWRPRHSEVMPLTFATCSPRRRENNSTRERERPETSKRRESHLCAGAAIGIGSHPHELLSWLQGCTGNRPLWQTEGASRALYIYLHDPSTIPLKLCIK